MNEKISKWINKDIRHIYLTNDTIVELFEQ